MSAMKMALCCFSRSPRARGNCIDSHRRIFSSFFFGSRGLLKRAISQKNMESTMENLSEVQRRQLDEQCILLNENDEVIGSASKKACHLAENINKGMLHRAFSVFLFNSKNELLLQQRSLSKMTFPGFFTNTCCSHPRATKSEMTEDNYLGIKKAAKRRLNFELGISEEQIPLDAITFLTKIHYGAPADTIWAEHEIDYVLFIQRDVDLKPNDEEIKTVMYVSQDELNEFMKKAENNGIKTTPWFRFIVHRFLKNWWDNLDTIHKFQEHNTIHRANFIN